MKLTRRQIAYEHIRGLLAEGGLADGARLSPAALAKVIGVSAIPVREAISQLQSEGFVVQEPRRGVFVRRPSRRQLVELIELRTVLETNAAGQAARRIRAEQLDELERHDSQLQVLAKHFADVSQTSVTDFREPLSRWMLTDLAFHMVLLRAAGNEHVIKVIADARIMTQMFGFRTDPPSAWADAAAYFVENYRVHNDIFRAVRKHDARAARRAMTAHMRLARKTMLSRYDWLSGQPVVDDPLAAEFPDSMRQRIEALQRRNIHPTADQT